MNNEKEERESRAIKIQIPSGYYVEDIGAEFITCVKPMERVSQWDEIGEISGFFINSDSGIRKGDFYTTEKNKNICVKKSQARALLAFSMLTQCVKQANGGWEPDWEDSDQLKYTINLANRQRDIVRSTSRLKKSFLCFKSEIIRDEFMKVHKDLIWSTAPLSIN